MDGQAITIEDVNPELKAELIDLENELEQRRMHLNWVGFEEAVNNRLLTAEAKRRGTTVKAMTEEIAAEATVGDEEVRKLYDENKNMIPVSFDEAAPTLRAQLEQDAGQRAVRRFSETLREKATIEYQLPVPDLPRYTIDSRGEPTLGSGEAAVTIVEFSDFQCPYCSQARELLKELKTSYGDRVSIVYRDFPLAQHQDARPAAAAAHCALEQDKFWDYHDRLFENPQALGSEELRGYAKELEIDLDAFESCLASDRPEAAIAEDESEARRLGVQGTPAIFINGVKLIGLLPLPLMKSIIEHELQRS